MRDQEMCCRAVVLAVNSRDQAHILNSALYYILNPLANGLSRGCPCRHQRFLVAVHRRNARSLTFQSFLRRRPTLQPPLVPWRRCSGRSGARTCAQQCW